MTTLLTDVEWDEGADVQFVVSVRRKSDSSRIDLTGSLIALEVRNKGVTSGGTLYLRASTSPSEGEGSITLLPPDEGETSAHRMLVVLPNTSGAEWAKGIAEVRVLFPAADRPVPVLRFPVTLRRKIVANV